MDSERASLKDRAEVDTGVFAREILGYNYDEIKPPGSKIPVKTRIGQGGVLPTGPHQQFVQALDGEPERILVLLPRNCLKSTIAQAFVLRMICQNPNIRIAYGMHRKDKVTGKSMAIRQCLEENTVMRELWGGAREGGTNSFVGDYWNQDSWTVRTRTEVGLQDPTFSAFSPESMLVGGHYHVMIYDDILDDKWVQSDTGIEKTLACWRGGEPMLLPGGKEIVIGTRYAFEDLYGKILRDHPEDYSIIEHDCGMQIVRKQDGRRVVEGEPAFGTLEKRKVQIALNKGYDFAVAQFWNQVSVGQNQAFHRDAFIAVDSHQVDIKGCSGFLLCDSATSERNPENCYSVIAYVLLDRDNVAYLADLRVGHLHPSVFMATWVEVLEKWRQRCNHRLECIESTTANDVYRAGIEERAHKRRIPLNIQKLSRSSNEDSKVKRITRLAPRFMDRRFRVIDDILPKTYIHGGEVRVLWNKTGFRDQDGIHYPAGELVDEFVKFPRYGWKDIPDALADIDAVRPDGSRVCSYMPPRPIEPDPHAHSSTEPTGPHPYEKIMQWAS